VEKQMNRRFDSLSKAERQALEASRVVVIEQKMRSLASGEHGIISFDVYGPEQSGCRTSYSRMFGKHHWRYGYSCTLHVVAERAAAIAKFDVHVDIPDLAS
jgi:hypothetical protein